MIVKNETSVIKRSLSSVKPIIDYWVIVDTGSTDGTQEMIKEFMKDVPGELHERPWVNFEHNRNEALQLAKGKADYTFFIDADEELVYDENFVLPHLDKDFYYVTMEHSGTYYETNQLINHHLDWKWVGVLHEYVHSDQARTFEILKGVKNIYRSEGCRSQDANKYLNDAKVLEAALKKEPFNHRYTFYLAQSYRDAGLKEKAADAYKLRAAMGGWDQEVFFSKYQAALLEEELGNADWIESYTDAFQYRPTRAEPLYHLARKFRLSGNYLMGYLVASHGCQIPYPKDVLFVKKWIYDYGLLLEKSVSAYWLGKYEECLQISQKILKEPNLPPNIKECAEKNIGWALLKIAPAQPPRGALYK
jgi:glycosyltransferase involved in cell wall biosynthesis